jgi:hypothetical protein
MLTVIATVGLISFALLVTVEIVEYLENREKRKRKKL